jgi:orotidine-5'-phosphate decarboxylase
MNHFVSNSKIIVALDLENIQQTRQLVAGLDPKMCRLKVGPVLFTRYGAALIEGLVSQQFSVFLDLKFHDIPQTVSEACRVAVDLGVWMLSLHIAGGPAMLESVRQVMEKSQAATKPLLVGITVLTSLDEHDLQLLGINEKVEDNVLRLARFGMAHGLDGVVSSAKEVAMLRSALPKHSVLVTPGIRLKEDANSDQKRVVTPKEAIDNGADFLVIGRSITHATNPLQQLEMISKEVA